MKKRLFFHIGYHKTGTSSIQIALNSRRCELSQNGFGVYSENPDGTDTKYGHACGWVDTTAIAASRCSRDCGLRVVDPEQLVRRLAEVPYPNVVVSAEHFCWIFDQDQILQLATLLKQHFDTQIILYLRRQDKLLVSILQQGAKVKYAAENYYFHHSAVLSQEFTEDCDAYLNFDRKVKMWEAGFGQENIKIRVMDKSTLVNGDTVADFWNVLGLDWKGERISANESNGFERTKIGALINQSNISYSLGRAIREGADNSGKLLPSRAAAQQFYLSFQESNKELNLRYQISRIHPDIFGQDFSDYPEIAEDIWTEDSANQAILNVLEAVGHITPWQLMRWHLKDLLKIGKLQKAYKNCLRRRLSHKNNRISA